MHDLTHKMKLRRRAEQICAEKAPLLPYSLLKTLPLEEIEKLVHELSVHQIELELQNEELRRAHTDLETEKVRTLEEKERYQELFDNAPMGYLKLDAEGRIFAANHTAAKLLGEHRETLAHRRLANFCPPEAQDTLYLHLRRLAKGAQRDSCELSLSTSADKPLQVHLESVSQGTSLL